MGVFSRIVPPLVSAFGLQAVCAAIFVPQANEKYYDLCGALGFLTTTAVSLYYPALRHKYLSGSTAPLPKLSSFAPRQLLLTGCIVIWSSRLGTFLLSRSLKHGGDSRFDAVKHQPGKFTFYWMAQAAWVFTVGLPIYMVNSMPAHLHPRLGRGDYISLGFIVSSFLFEIIADHQKTAWKKDKLAKKHEEQFLTSGLWSISRHPNYLGEIGIWSGMWALSVSSLMASPYSKLLPAIASVSPVFTYLLLRYVSGVPPLERNGDKKFGADPRWQEYKRTVPVLWPWGPMA